MNEEQIRRSLAHVDDPRSPRPEFEGALLTRLLQDEEAADDSGVGPVIADDVVPLAELDDDQSVARRRGRFLVGALAAALLVVVGVAVMFGQGGSGVRVTREPPAPTAESACSAFSDATFDGVTGRELIGLGNEALLADRTLAGSRVAAFGRATRAFQSGLRAAGVESANLDSSFTEILRFVADSEAFAAADEMSRVAVRLHEAETVVIALQRELTKLGVVNCVAWIT